MKACKGTDNLSIECKHWHAAVPGSASLSHEANAALWFGLLQPLRQAQANFHSVPIVVLCASVCIDASPCRGNPSDPEYYAYIKSYSPVDNIGAKAYPHLLATAGLHDPRVSAKSIAATGIHTCCNC